LRKLGSRETGTSKMHEKRKSPRLTSRVTLFSPERDSL
jgi:hypothetical protein